MSKIVSIFNNKGGVGKTTYLFHIAHCLFDKGKRVLMVDCDSQCNLTAYCLSDREIQIAWATNGNSIYRAIEEVARTIGDIRNRAPSRLADGFFLIPGDLLLSDFEDKLGDTWSSARGGDEGSLRAQSAIYRSILRAAEKAQPDIILIDLGPNLGALNRAVLGGSDFIVIPVAPDLFSIRGTENLGSKLLTWGEEWGQCNQAWRNSELKLPEGRPKFLGYVVQQHNVRNNAQGMTRGWQIFGTRIEQAIQANIVGKLAPLNQVHTPSSGNFNLGKIPNLHSLIPYSLETRKPVFKCTSKDGLRGAHITAAAESRHQFAPMADAVIAAVSR
ncbi:MAG TPA: AAA family ATPase [Verrucomicrobiota bacterium]|nr:AAA family ATPase [Verrucomicrobiota bacterium]